MRTVKNPQFHFGEVNIADIDLSARFRDDIPAILKWLTIHLHYGQSTKKGVCGIRKNAGLAG